MSESDSSGTATQPAAPQFIQSTIPLPSKLDFKGNLTANWKKFKRLWTNYKTILPRVKVINFSPITGVITQHHVSGTVQKLIGNSLVWKLAHYLHPHHPQLINNSER